MLLTAKHLMLLAILVKIVLVVSQKHVLITKHKMNAQETTRTINVDGVGNV